MCLSLKWSVNLSPLNKVVGDTLTLSRFICCANLLRSVAAQLVARLCCTTLSCNFLRNVVPSLRKIPAQGPCVGPCRRSLASKLRRPIQSANLPPAPHKDLYEVSQSGNLTQGCARTLREVPAPPSPGGGARGGARAGGFRFVETSIRYLYVRRYVVCKFQ